MESAAVCRRCGAALVRPGARFCPACGTALQKPGIARWFISLGVVAVLGLVAGVGVVLFSGRSSTNPGAGFITGSATDLSSAPTAMLRGGPSADQMSLDGLSLGTELAEDRRADGDEFLVAGGRVSQISIGRPDLLRACGVYSEHDISRQFGDDFTAVQRDGPYTMFSYARRGLTVQWDARARRLNRITLRPPVGP